jgi:hypothetical protein
MPSKERTMNTTKYDGNKTVAWADVGWQPKEIKRAPIGTIKLSEAIRIGAAKRPQCTGAMFKNGASCAVGAIYEAVFGRIHDSGDHGLGDALAYRELRDRFGMFKVGGDAWDVAVFKRNDAGMKREEIADWLESQGY